MLYRILTEDKNRPGVMQLVERHLNGATVYHGRGLWQGVWEGSLIIEAEFGRVHDLAGAIKELNKQDAVLVQEISCKSYLI